MKPPATLPGVSIPGRKNARPRKQCQCSDSIAREVKNGHDVTIALMCTLCTLPIGLQCRVCTQFFRDLQHHLVESEKCGAYERKEAEKDKPRRRSSRP